MRRDLTYSVVRIDLPASLRAMEPAIIVISGRFSLPRQGCMGPRPSIVVVAGGTWWRSEGARRAHAGSDRGRRDLFDRIVMALHVGKMVGYCVK